MQLPVAVTRMPLVIHVLSTHRLRKASSYNPGFPASFEDWARELRRFRPVDAARRFAPRPMLVMHGDDDQIVPIAGSAMLSSKMVKGATLKVYKGFDHGMCSTHHDVINADFRSFFKA